ncbi:hypothetical protein PS6_011777 [Mucor atramentarius]
MKLRNRQRHISNDIKQGDHRPYFTRSSASSSTVNKTGPYSLDATQRDAKKGNSLFQQDDQFNGKDYYYRCDRCRQTSPNLKSVMEHRASVHNVKSRKGSMVKDINVEPDVHDPSFYCESCKVSYTDKNRYRQHLKTVHYMVLKTMRLGKALQNTNTPDHGDLNLPCRACDPTYAGKATHKQDCRHAHEIVFAKPYRRCKLCKMDLSEEASYKEHLYDIHNMDCRLPHQTLQDVLPNFNDPNYYCPPCNRSLPYESSFLWHLEWVHAMYTAGPRKLVPVPNINDDNNYCRLCQCYYPCKKEYRLHLDVIHSIPLEDSS